MTDTLILFAPGAGAPSTSAWMQAWAARLATLGTVETLDYPYMREGRRAPDPLARLVAAHAAALEAARHRHPDARRVVLAGKSMGARVGCHLSLAAPVAGVVCLGFPLRGAGKAGKLRDEVLLAMTAPVLFVQGTRDPLCPLDLLAGIRPRMKARSELHVVSGGDHSLGVPKRGAVSQEASDAAALDAIRRFVAGLAPA
jgi:predicted alpha/beta-hydrolase family hydrolase